MPPHFTLRSLHSIQVAVRHCSRHTMPPQPESCLGNGYIQIIEIWPFPKLLAQCRALRHSVPFMWGAGAYRRAIKVFIPCIR